MPSSAPPLRRARVSIALVFAVHGAVTGSFATRIPALQDRLQLSPGELGLALVMPAVGASLAMPLAGRVTHRLGARAAIRLLLALWCSALALPGLAPGLPWLCLALLVYGAASGMADVAMNAEGVEVERRLGKSIMSGLHGMWSLGGLVASAFGALAARQHLGACVHLAIAAAVLLTLGQLVGAGLLDVRPEPQAEAPPRFALPPRSALLIGLVGFCAVFAEGAGSDWAGVYLRDLTGAAAGTAAMAYTAFAFTMTAARLAGDAVVRRLGPVRTVRLGGAVAAAGGVLVVVAGSPAVAIPGFALLGIGIAVVIPLAFAAAGHAGPNPSQAIAGVATVTYTSGLIAPAIVGTIAQGSSLRVSFTVVTVLVAALIGTAGTLRSAGASASVPGEGTTAHAEERAEL
ncbi:MFS transporter [Kitasatospora kifunensis]|uniref:MFS family permease n=1 Tax=Kitasatospora kifunensis TaxID=58351 RepID=A0A7W7R7W6_KITKI|nr:MFS transporter [Kitasatospora kifunensis]MBB4927048.1 MFS family permease [Kitasatospora kifunensis]